MLALRDRQPLAVGFQVGFDHRQPGRRRGRVLGLLGEPARRVEVGQRPVATAGQGADEGPEAQGRGGPGVPRQDPLGVDQGADLEDLVRRAPLVLG